MTMVGGGGSDNSAQLLEFIMNLKQKQREVQHNKALALLNSMHPGETLGSIPGALKAWKTATGVEGDPSRAVSEETMAHLMDKNEIKTLLGMTPEAQVALATSSIINKNTGRTGTPSLPSFQSDVKAEATTARLKSDVATVGADSFAKAPPAEKVAISQRQTFGETGKQTLAQEGTAQATSVQETAKGQVATAQGKIATEFYTDPANSAFGKMLTENHQDPMAVAEAFATGQGSIITGMQQLQQERISQAGQTERAKIQVAGELTKQFNQGRIDTAKVFSDKTGIPIQTTLSIESSVESGQNPFEIVIGKDGAGQPIKVNPDYVQSWLKAKQLGFEGYIREQVNKNNPQLDLLKTLIENGQKFAADPKKLTAYNTLATHNMAEVVTERELGMPRPDIPGEAQDLWDKRAQENYNTFGLIGKDPEHWWGGGNMKTTDPISFRQKYPVGPPPMPALDPASNKGNQAPGTPANYGTVGAKPDSIGGPKFVNKDAAKAIGNVLSGLQDSTLIKR